MTVGFDETPPLPHELQVEVTGACNLRCHMCLVRYRPALDRREGSLSLEAFRRVVDALPDLERVTLQGLGEPLLAPDLLPMVEYATARGIRVGFNTNATLLTRAWAEQLVRAGLDWIHISLDGGTAATYEGIRDGARFDRVTANIEELMATIRRLHADRPDASLVFVAMQRNVAELPDVVRLAARAGVKRVWVQNLSHSFSDTDPAGEYAEIRGFAEREALWAESAAAVAHFDAARNAASTLGVDLRLPRLEPPPPERTPGEPGCDWPWRSAFLTHDAHLQPCCMVMGADRARLGSVKARPFAEVWDDEAYRAFRRALLTDNPPDVCRGCSAYRRVF